MNKSLLIDIGNSNTIFAELINQKTNFLGQSQTSKLESYLEKLNLKQYQKLIISSVVPKLNSLFQNYNPVFIDHENIPIIKIGLKNPEEIGADRLVNALAAYNQTLGSCLVIDAGTAITLCYIDVTGVYQGGIIYPGMRIASCALNDYTAKIPLIYAEPINKLFGGNTKEAVQIGLFKGTIQMLNGLIKEYREFDPKIKVIGTGTGLEVLRPYLNLDIYIKDLIFSGLAICATSQKCEKPL
ncbi:type III pantothenate kinase [Candidatus Margulisiibacteriota bacterium]